MGEETQTADRCCITGHIHAGTPRGKDEELGDVACYVTGREGGGRRAVLILTDAFGHKLVNSRLVADALAESLSLPVFMPDIVKGDPADIKMLDGLTDATPGLFAAVRRSFLFATRMPYMVSWLSRHRQSEVKPVVKAAAAALQDRGYNNVGVVGYCFGGLAAVGSTPGVENVKAVVAVHPGKFAVPADLDALTAPVLLQFAEKDRQWSMAAMTEAGAAAERKGDGSRHEVYLGVSHGFAIRGDPNDATVVECKERALRQAVEFLRPLIKV